VIEKIEIFMRVECTGIAVICYKIKHDLMVQKIVSHVKKSAKYKDELKKILKYMKRWEVVRLDLVEGTTTSITFKKTIQK
jgi:hypothetical protein